MEKTVVVIDKKAPGGPRRETMYPVDAQAAVANDPDRFEIESQELVRGPVTLEERVATLERRLDEKFPPPAPKKLKRVRKATTTAKAKVAKTRRKK